MPPCPGTPQHRASAAVERGAPVALPGAHAAWYASTADILMPMAPMRLVGLGIGAPGPVDGDAGMMIDTVIPMAAFARVALAHVPHQAVGAPAQRT